jgi:hypothetical protein
MKGSDFMCYIEVREAYRLRYITKTEYIRLLRRVIKEGRNGYHDKEYNYTKIN